MNLADTMRALGRRWYISIPGLILAIAVALGGWVTIKPTYERTATLLLLPNKSSVPTGDNPYLYIGGLTQAADVMVRAVNSDAVTGQIAGRYPGTKISVYRDPTTSGPVLLIDVTAKTDGAAAGALDETVTATGGALDDIQTKAHVTKDDRITLAPVTVDAASTLVQKTRMMTVGGAFVAVLLLVFFVVALIDGHLQRRKRRLAPETIAEVDADGKVPELHRHSRVRAEGDTVVTASFVRDYNDQEHAPSSKTVRR